jgi:hypothetical protein
MVDGGGGAYVCEIENSHSVFLLHSRATSGHVTEFELCLLLHYEHIII